MASIGPPEVHLLSNGRYHVMVTDAGAGYSRWKGLAITRWREDLSCDSQGAFCYIRDLAGGQIWSTTMQPTLQRADSYEAAFSAGRATFCRRDHAVEVATEMAVSPVDDIELRRVRITNHSSAMRVLELTSYAEIVLEAPAIDSAHPAFEKLFVETEILRESQLVRRDAALIQLLDPPINHSDPSPGYIQGYVQGVRENGGQYTHAAVWAAMAFAAVGDAQRAWELFAMIVPVNHARSPEAVEIYKTEPYVRASDVYALAPHTGRGGWTWYTGSAGWMVRYVLESLLGLRVESDTLRIVPCLPVQWASFRMHYRYRETIYHISVQQIGADDGAPGLTLDGVALGGPGVTLVDDRREHSVAARIQKPGARD